MRPAKMTGFILAGLLITVLLAGGVSYFASGDPDGLDTVTLQGCELDGDHEITGGECMAMAADDHPIGGPFADYGMAGIDNEFLSTAVSGVLGALVVFIIGLGLFWLLRNRSARSPEPDSENR